MQIGNIISLLESEQKINLLLQDFMRSCAVPFHCLTPAEAEGLVPPGLFGLQWLLTEKTKTDRQT